MVSLILDALIRGASRVAEPAVRDAYDGLKALIRRRFFHDQPQMAVALEHPQDARPQLEEALTRAGADRDPELVAQAQTVLTNLQTNAPMQNVNNQGANIGKQYNSSGTTYFQE